MVEVRGGCSQPNMPCGISQPSPSPEPEPTIPTAHKARTAARFQRIVVPGGG